MIVLGIIIGAVGVIAIEALLVLGFFAVLGSGAG